MHFTCQTKVNDDIEFQYYNKIKNIVDKMTMFCNYMCVVTKWEKRHEFSNSINTNCKSSFQLIHSYKGQLINRKCVVQ
jgi:hypothetical protein